MSLRSKLIRLAHEKPEMRPHLLPLLAGQKTAASEIEIDDLPREQAKIFKVFPRHDATQAFHGVHGYIVMFKAGLAGVRFDKGTLKKLLSVPTLRWVGSTDDGRYIDVGLS